MNNYFRSHEKKPLKTKASDAPVNFSIYISSTDKHIQANISLKSSVDIEKNFKALTL